MKKSIIFLTMIVFLYAYLYAQENKKIEFSVIGGINFYKQTFSNIESFPLPQHDPKLGYDLGLGAHVDVFDKFSLEADVLYKTKESELVEFSGLDWEETFYRYKYLVLPIMAHYHFHVSKVEILATLGVESGILLKSQLEDKRNDIIIEAIEYVKKSDFQFISGLGLRYKRFSLAFRYGLGLLNLNKEEESELVVKNRGIEFIFSFYVF